MSASRRDFLRVGAAAGGGLLLGLHLPGALASAAAADFQPNAFIRIGRDGKVVLVMPKIEMGQGIHTAFAQLIAEELEVPLDRVTNEDAPPDDRRYGDASFAGLQMTGGSTSVRGSWMIMRKAGATARALLVSAAAQSWQVDAASLLARDGEVHDPASGKSLAYGLLVDKAALLPVPQDVVLKKNADFKLIGKPAHRMDGKGKVDGSTVFGIDVRLPGLKVATVAACPVFGGTLASFNEAAAMKVPGVRQVVRLGNAVAVVGDHFWAAKKGLQAAAPQWNEGPNASLNTAQIFAQLEAAARQPGAVGQKFGDAQQGLSRAVQRLDAVYKAPLLAHATMEPMNCTAQVAQGEVDIWVGTQVPTRAQAAAARAAGVPVERVRVHNHLLGGGFGRRLEVDFIEQAVSIAKQVQGPVKVVWSREEDIQHDMYRPAYHDTLSAGLDAAGKPIAWTHRVAASSIMARFFPEFFVNGLDPDAVEGAVQLPYALPAVQVDYVRAEPPGVPTAFWRGVGPTHNAFVVEGFVDELAYAAGQDPLAYRLAFVNDPRARQVLVLAASKAGWGKPLPEGQGRGIALVAAFGSYIAQVIQVAVSKSGEVQVLRVDCAVDCGLAVNPDTVAAQMQGGIVFGLSAALWGEITLEKGRVRQHNFYDYRIMRMSEVPQIEVHIVSSTEAPGGVGEPGTSCAIPAVANAVCAATRHRIRTLPIGRQLATAS